MRSRAIGFRYGSWPLLLSVVFLAACTAGTYPARTTPPVGVTPVQVGRTIDLALSVWRLRWGSCAGPPPVGSKYPATATVSCLLIDLSIENVGKGTPLYSPAYFLLQNDRGQAQTIDYRGGGSIGGPVNLKRGERDSLTVGFAISVCSAMVDLTYDPAEYFRLHGGTPGAPLQQQPVLVVLDLRHEVVGTPSMTCDSP